MGSAPFIAVLLLLIGCAGAHAQAPESWHGTPPRSVERIAPAQGPAYAREADRGTAPTHAAEQAPEHEALGRALAKKFENPDYAAALAARNRIPTSHDMPEEHAVRRARSKLTLARRAPPGARVLGIPLTATPPTVDGVVQPGEWERALRLTLEPADKGSEVLLLAHGATLYLAALAPADRTEDGFDQFRFWFHLELSPFLENERAFIAGRGRLISLRGVRLPRDGATFTPSQPLSRLLAKTDWNIYSASRGASSMTGYRQFEMALDLAETGLPKSAPFPAFVEIEGDPVRDPAGKFKARLSLGQLGTAKAPLWLRIGPSP